jgi:hypothetical protein
MHFLNPLKGERSKGKREGGGPSENFQNESVDVMNPCHLSTITRRVHWGRFRSMHFLLCTKMNKECKKRKKRKKKLVSKNGTSDNVKNLKSLLMFLFEILDNCIPGKLNDFLQWRLKFILIIKDKNY